LINESSRAEYDEYISAYMKLSSGYRNIAEEHEEEDARMKKGILKSLRL
jgi:hypothetical protein